MLDSGASRGASRSGDRDALVSTLEGVCYLVNSFVNFLAPQLSGLAFSVLAVSVVGEIWLCLWLLVMGVNLAKWNEKTRLAVVDIEVAKGSE